MNRRGIACSILVVAALTYSVRAQPQVAPTPEPTIETPVVQTPGSSPSIAVDSDRPTTAAVPTSEVPSPAAPSHAPEQVMWALAVSYLIRYLTKSKWFTFLNEDTANRAKAQVAFLAAVLTTAGIHFTVTGSVLDGDGASVTATGLSLNAVKDVVFQWASQQGWYDGLVKRS